MRSAFTRGRRGRVVGAFSLLEADLLRNLVSQVVELVADESPEPRGSDDPLEAMLDLDGPVSAPHDPVLARLLPDAYADDSEAAGEFRRYTERSLREQKSVHGRQVIADLEAGGLPSALPEPGQQDDDEQVAGRARDDEVELDLAVDRQGAWLRSLTDVRLALATRLGVQEGDEAHWDSLPDDDPRVYMHDVYDWLGYVQETFVRALR